MSLGTGMITDGKQTAQSLQCLMKTGNEKMKDMGFGDYQVAQGSDNIMLVPLLLSVLGKHLAQSIDSIVID